MTEYLAAGLKVTGGIAGFAGNMNAAGAATSQGEANAAYFEMMGDLARKRATINAGRIRKEGVAVGSRIVQSIGAAGVDARDGSALDQLGAHAAEYEFRALTTKWAGDNEAASFSYKAAMARWQGQVSASKAYSQAVMSLLNGGGAIAGLDWGGDKHDVSGGDPTGSVRTAGDADLGGYSSGLPSLA